jgi:hypothetical protein
MATRLYIANDPPPFTPAVAGTWGDATATIRGYLGAKFGLAATSGKTERSSTATAVLLGIWISDVFKTDTTFAVTDTISFCAGALESASAMTATFRYHIWITTGNTSTVRGTLAANVIGTKPFPTTAAGVAEATTSAAVTAYKGDRIVFELGYYANNTSTTSYTGTINYGNTGVTDLTDTSANVTTEPGWLQFSNDILFGRYPLTSGASNFQSPAIF